MKGHQMLAKLRKDQENEEGFTLIELLVVVIIIGILAAIAIPVFLNQREKAFKSAVKADLRNASTQLESEYTDSYDYRNFTAADIQGQASTGVTLTPVTHTKSAYCIEGTHEGLADKPAAEKYFYIQTTAGSTSAKVSEGECA